MLPYATTYLTLLSIKKNRRMKKNLSLLFVVAIAVLFQGCIKDKCRSTYNYTFYKAVYKTKAEVRANIRSNAPKAIERPGKIYVRAPYIFLNEIDKGIHIIDNSNPLKILPRWMSSS